MSSRLSLTISRLAYMAAPLAALLALAGCMPKSLAPAVADGDRVVDRRVVGRWQSDDHEWVEIQLRDSSYGLRYTDKDGKAAPLVGRLGRLGNRWILDLAPDGSGLPKVSDAYKGLLVPVHTFLVLDSIAPRMQVWGIKQDSLEKYLEREPTAVAHMEVEGDPVLTAPTPELRAFLERYIARPGVLEPSTWTKQ